MMKKMTPVLMGMSLLALTACGNDNNDSTDNDSTTSNEETTEETVDQSNEENGAETNEPVELDNTDVLATSDAGDVTTEDIINELGTEAVGNQTFQLILDKIVKDKYADEVDEDEIHSAVDREIEAMGGTEQFEAMVAQSNPGMTVERYKEQQVTNAYHDAFLQDVFDISDDEVRSEAVKASHILIAVADEDDEEGLSDEEANERAQSLIEELQDGADFNALASEHSDDPASQAREGSLGVVQRGEMVEEFENALFDLEPGEMSSEPVETQFGYHIIQRGEELSDEELVDARSQVVTSRVADNREDVLNAYEDLLEEYNTNFENETIRNYIEESYFNRDEDNSDSETSDTEDSNDENSNQ